MMDWKGVCISLLAAIATGGAFTQDIPQGANGWWKFGCGLVIGFAAQYLAYTKQPTREVWTDEQRKEKA